MSETSPVITVKQEVETVLRITAEAYAVQTEAADDLVKGNAEFHEAVLAVLDDIIEAYVAPEPVFEDPEIRVGDTVRVTQAVAYDVGTKFVVDAIKDATYVLQSGEKLGPHIYKGDPNDYGVWSNFVEKVHA